MATLMCSRHGVIARASVPRIDWPSRCPIYVNDGGIIPDPCGKFTSVDTNADVLPTTGERLVAEAIERRVVDPATGGEKGQKLAQLGAVCPRALIELGKVAGHGAEKYARYNFLKGYNWSLSYDALQRHLGAFWDGEDVDPESGLYHLAHAGWHCLALLAFVLRGLGSDDRPGR